MTLRFLLWITLIVIVSIHLCASQEEINDEDESHQTVRDGLLNFGVRLHNVLFANNAEHKNLLFSPINIYTALALLHLGTNGTTHDEISGILGMPESYQPETLHKILKNFTLEAQNGFETRWQLGNGTRGKVKACDLNMANGIFVQEGVNLTQSFAQNAKSYYDSEIINVNFVNKGAEATDTINKYVANKTSNRITQLFKEPQSPNTRLILTSTLYFKSLWLYKFNRSLTHPDEFHTYDGNVTVPMMHRSIMTPYANISSLGVEAIDLKFADQAFCMFVVMPYENRSLNEFLSNLTSDDINTIVNETTRNHRVDLKFPDTAFNWSKSIKDELAQLGLSKVFNDGADLSNMVESNNIKLEQISHSTDIKINEDGTEASAVTPQIMVLKMGVRVEDAKFYVKRPFFFFIYHHTIRTVLFYGTVYYPNGK